MSVTIVVSRCTEAPKIDKQGCRDLLDTLNWILSSLFSGFGVPDGVELENIQSNRGPIRNLSQNAHMDCRKSSSASALTNYIADEQHTIQFTAGDRECRRHVA